MIVNWELEIGNFALTIDTTFILGLFQIIQYSLVLILDNIISAQSTFEFDNHIY
jgi:hypothetical protein